MEDNANDAMSGAENKENDNQGLENNQESSQESQNPENQQPTSAEIAAAFLKENEIEFTSIEELKNGLNKPAERVEVNPYADILDDDDKAYLNYKKETGRGRKDFEALNANIDDIPKLQLAREKVRKESGLTNLTDEQADEYLTDTLEIDLEDLSGTGQIKLAQYTKSIIEEKKAEQEKYRQPLENKQEQNQQQQPQGEYVQLSNGSVMRKADYENLVENRQKEIEIGKEAVNGVTAYNFKVIFDDNGTNREENYGYEFDDKDRHSMVSIVSDVDAVIASRYRSEKGEWNHKQFAEDMFWSDPKNREKAFASMIHKAVAKNTEEILKQRGNVSYDSTKPLQTNNSEKGTVKSFNEIFNS